MADVIRASITGALPGGEVWSVNPVFKLTTGAVVTALELSAAVTAINALTVPAGLLNIMTTTTTVTGVILEARTHAGDLEARAEGLRGTPAAGSSSAAKPLQTSVVCSLRTVAGGAHGRGRLYWPATGVGLVPATSRLDLTNVPAVIAAFKTYLVAIQGAIDASVDETVGLAVWSRTSGSSATVATLRVGDVPDVQRRRRDSITETYTDLSYV